MNISRRNFVKYAGLMGGVAGAGALAGCSGSSSDSSSSASGSSSTGSDSKIKIGVSIWSSTDALGKLSVDIIKKAADILGVEVTTVDQGTSPSRSPLPSRRSAPPAATASSSATPQTPR